MRGKIGSLLAALAMVLLLAMPALASDAQAQLPYVNDFCDLLTEQEESRLEEQAKLVSQAGSCSVYIILLDDYGDYGYDVDDAAESLYLTYDLGWGPERDGMVLLLSMEERDYALTCHGSLGNQVFDATGRSWLEDQMLGYLGENDWYHGCLAYVEGCGELLSNRDPQQEQLPQQWQEEQLPVTVEHRTGTTSRGGFGGRLLKGILVGCVPALIVCLVMKGKMKTAKAATHASQYMTPGSVRVTTRDEQFLHTTVHRQRLDHDNHGGRSGGSRSSGGGRSGGGSRSGFSSSKGKF